MPAESGISAPVFSASRQSPVAASLDFLRRLFQTRFGGIGLVILVTVTFLSTFAPWFASSSPSELGAASLQPPSWEHPLGTDNLGRDIRSVMLYPGPSSLTI